MVHLMLHFPRLIKDLLQVVPLTQAWMEFYCRLCKEGEQKKGKTITILKQESNPFCVKTCRSSLRCTQRSPPGISTGFESDPALVSKGAVSHCDQQLVSSRKSPTTTSTPLPLVTPPPPSEHVWLKLNISSFLVFYFVLLFFQLPNPSFQPGLR